MYNSEIKKCQQDVGVTKSGPSRFSQGHARNQNTGLNESHEFGTAAALKEKLFLPYGNLL
ncbi:hypothetical protein T10_9659 [Trichinella papuae]|uniref:Uncharacterized protein n=1 Tax=Trichinella papuae TaxID=268474 RepID=A0A0V1MUW2_9BILA|nr:hypothetical protein T10_9659 [Trichinella papuae]